LVTLHQARYADQWKMLNAHDIAFADADGAFTSKDTCST
jgi:hypothetical protein